MPVYAIQAGDESGPVKLGKADDPRARLAALQTAHWLKLTLLRVWKGERAEEAMLHLRFAPLRLAGEWFNFSREMLGDVGLDVIADLDIPQALTTPADVIRAAGGAHYVAGACHVEIETAKSWRKLGIPPEHQDLIAGLAARSAA